LPRSLPTRLTIIPSNCFSAVTAPNGSKRMSTKTTNIERLPIRLVLFYVAVTVFVFIFGPFDWPVENWPTLLGFLAGTMFALWLGFRWAVARTVVGTPFGGWRRIMVFGAAASLIILFVTAPIYTGRMPWDVLSALRDQGAAYEALQDQLQLTAGTRGPIALARILTWPLVFAVLPLGVLHWAEMGAPLRVLMLTTIGSIVVSSILRGTDRETADLIAVAGGAGVVLLARKMVFEGLTLRDLFRRYRLAMIASLVLLSVAASLFAQRKEERFLYRTALCIAHSEQTPTGICADFDHPWFSLLDDGQRFTASIAVAYFTQGYYGLSLALALDDFRSTWGLGNAPFAMAAYARLTGDEELYENSYTFRLRAIGWSDQHQWSTMFPWIANDISFPMVPVFMLLIGALFGASWRDAVFAHNDRAAIVFVLLILMMGYLPANSQVTLVPDHYFALIVWIYVWRRARRHALQSAKYVATSNRSVTTSPL
jgi:hypothetical protein